MGAERLLRAWSSSRVAEIPASAHLVSCLQLLHLTPVTVTMRSDHVSKIQCEPGKVQGHRPRSAAMTLLHLEET